MVSDFYTGDWQHPPITGTHATAVSQSAPAPYRWRHARRGTAGAESTEVPSKGPDRPGAETAGNISRTSRLEARRGAKCRCPRGAAKPGSGAADL